jgi:hypothetical protein
MKTNITLKSALLFIGLFLSLFISASIYNVNQATGSFSVLNNDYSDDLNHTWNINIGTLQKVNIYYTLDTEMGCDYFEIYDVDVNDNSTLLASFSGSEYGNITTTSMSGKFKVVFYTDGSVCWDYGYTGITFSFISNDNVESIAKNLKVLANSSILGDNIVIGNTGLGIATPEEKLHINGNIRGNASGGALRVNTESGYLDLGSMNDGWAHIYTDRPNIIANTPIWSIAGAFSAYQSSDLKLQTNGTTRMTILPTSGNVGIGTPTPLTKLDVDGEITFGTNQSYSLLSGRYAGAAIKMGTSSSTWDRNMHLGFIDNNRVFSSYLSLIHQNGNVGIGTENPSAPLQIGNSLSDIGTPKMRIAAPATGTVGSVIDALHIDSHDGGNFDKGVAISLGHMSSTYGEYTSRIIHYGNTNQTRASKLQLQTHNANHGVWNTGVLIDQEGKVGIGLTNPDELLTVNGTIHAKEVRVDLTGSLADYVFSPDYTLMPLHKVEAFVKTNKHLPEIPSAAEVKEKGLNMGEMQNKLLQKIEELTLYVIELQKELQMQRAEIDELKRK